MEEGSRGGREPIGAWRRFSSEAELILRTASELHEGQGWTKLARGEAHRLWYGSLAPPVQQTEENEIADIDWRWVQSALNRWVGLGDVRPVLQVDRDLGVTVGLGTVGSLTKDDMYITDRGFFFRAACGLFGALAAQLLLVAQNKGGFAFCTSCQHYFEPEGRKPRAGERHFCLDCKGKHTLYAARDYRERKRVASASGASKRGKGRKQSPRRKQHALRPPTT